MSIKCPFCALEIEEWYGQKYEEHLSECKLKHASKLAVAKYRYEQQKEELKKSLHLVKQQKEELKQTIHDLKEKELENRTLRHTLQSPESLFSKLRNANVSRLSTVDAVRKFEKYLMYQMGMATFMYSSSKHAKTLVCVFGALKKRMVEERIDRKVIDEINIIGRYIQRFV